VTALVDYIKTVSHPHIERVTFHNSPDETVAQSLARLVLAQFSVGGISSFGVFPVLATFGTGYWHEPRYGPFVNGWTKAEPRVDTLLPNVHILEDANYIMVSDMKKLWETKGKAGVLAWFTQNDDT
jgi:hypothetical protein